MSDFEGTSEAIILVKATPRIGKQHGETVCCAGIDDKGEWVRIYPVIFRTLDQKKRFGRWDRIKFRWRRPSNDRRPESLRIDHQSIEIIGKLKERERERFLSPYEVVSLDSAKSDGKTLALLRPSNVKFFVEKKLEEEIEDDRNKFRAFASQPDLFNSSQIIPYEPCPYSFKYQFEAGGSKHVNASHDWETHATYYKWSQRYGEQEALKKMQHVFGEEYPQKGMLFAMGTHSRYRDVWLINGVIRLDEIKQMSLNL